MNQLNTSKKESWFWRFSYDFKLKFILLFGYCPNFIIFYLIFSLFFFPYFAVNKQLKGFYLVHSLNSATDKIFYPSFFGQKEIQQDEFSQNILMAKKENLFRDSFSPFFKDHSDILSVNQAKQKIKLLIEQLEHKEKLLKEELIKEKSHVHFLAFSLKIQEEIASIFNTRQTLFSHLIEQFNLLSNGDATVHQYSKIILQTLPALQNLILEIKKNFYSLFINEKNYVELTIQLQAHLATFNYKQTLLYTILSADLLTNLNNEKLNQKFNEQLVAFKNDFIQLGQLVDLGKRRQTFDQLDKNLVEEKLNTLMTLSFNLSHTLELKILERLNQQQSGLWQNFSTSFFILMVGTFLVICIYIARIIRKPLNNLLESAHQFSQGHLSSRAVVSTQDEVGRIVIAFNAMADYFEKNFLESTSISNHLYEASSHVVSSVKEIDTNLNKQEKTIKEIGLHSRQILRTAQEFAENINKVTQSVSLTTLLASTGRINLDKMGFVMQLMIHASSNIVKTLSLLKEKTNSIGQVIESIIRIADQSNLLSLNTMIRANQSGKEGKGFVIIADRIHEMANQIAKTTLDIEKVVQDIMADMTNSVRQVDLFSEKINTQVHETIGIQDEFNKLISVTQMQFTNFEDLKEKIKNQITEIIDIDKIIQELKKGAEKNTYSIKKLSQEISHLSDFSQHLQKFIKAHNFFK